MTDAAAMMSKLTGIDLPAFSTQQVYNDTRIKQGTFNTDSGSYASSAEWVAKNIGFAKESSFAYGTSNLYVTPSATVHEEAGLFKITGFTHTNIEKSTVGVANYIQSMLMQGKPVLVDAYVHYGFGVDPNQFLNPINGGHAYLVTGYDKPNDIYEVMTSWGGSWANGGVGHIKGSDLPGIGPTSGGPFGTPYQDLIGLSTIDGYTHEGTTFDFTWTPAKMEAARYYATILDRAAEISGLEFWASFDGVMSNQQMADNMINSTEGQARFGGMSNGQFVEAMYENVLGRHSDQAGYDYFVNFLDNGQTRGQVISGVIDYLAANNADLPAYDFLANKTNLSTYISVSMHYTGGQDADTVHALDLVTSDANALEIIKVGVYHDLGYV